MPSAPTVRLTGGDCAGRAVRGAAGSTRPATARLRRSIFDRPDVQERLQGRALDLYAGAGLLGLEALSRGAPAVDFVEHDRPACDIIRANLAALDCAQRARIFCRPVERASRRLSPPYHLCFADPPYAHDASADLAALLQDGLLTPDGLLLWRHPWRRPAPERLGRLVRQDQRRYGDAVLDTFARTPRARRPQTTAGGAAWPPPSTPGASTP